MRVIAGKARGHTLRVPPSPQVRPATEKVRGAVFNILGDIEGLKVLDLFAGSGSVGIEALSRGASCCDFVEQNRGVAEIIQKNLQHCHFEPQGKVWVLKAAAAIPKLQKLDKTFDLVFVDPPYDKNLLNPTLHLLAHSSLFDSHALLVCEHSPRETPHEEKLEIIDQRKYGQTYISFLRKR